MGMGMGMSIRGGERRKVDGVGEGVWEGKKEGDCTVILTTI